MLFQVLEDNQEKDSTRKDGTLEKKSKGESGAEVKGPQTEAITLPLGYDPLGLLEQVESLYNFSTKAAHNLPPQGDTKVLV